MNNETKKIIDQTTLNFIYEFINTHENLILTYYLKSDSDYYLPEYTIKNISNICTGDKVVDRLKEKNENNFSLFHTKLTPGKHNINNACTIIVEPSIEQLFYFSWQKKLQEQSIENFYSVSGKIIPCINSLVFLNKLHLNDVFFQQFINIKSTLIGIPKKEQLIMFLELLSQQEKHKIIPALRQFCNNNKSLFNRIESQNLLKNFLTQYEHNCEDFVLFQKNMNIENIPIFNIIDCVNLEINKKNAFTTYYNPYLQDKYQLTRILEEIVLWLNHKDNAAQFNIKSVFLNNKSEMQSNFILTICFSEQYEHKKMIHIIDELLYQSANCSINANDLKNHFSKFYQHYKLKNLIDNKNIKTKHKKI